MKIALEQEAIDKIDEFRRNKGLSAQEQDERDSLLSILFMQHQRDGYNHVKSNNNQVENETTPNFLTGMTNHNMSENESSSNFLIGMTNHNISEEEFNMNFHSYSHTMTNEENNSKTLINEDYFSKPIEVVELKPKKNKLSTYEISCLIVKITIIVLSSFILSKVLMNTILNESHVNKNIISVNELVEPKGGYLTTDDTITLGSDNYIVNPDYNNNKGQ